MHGRAEQPMEGTQWADAGSEGASSRGLLPRVEMPRPIFGLCTDAQLAILGSDDGGDRASWRETSMTSADAGIRTSR
jgi:hypothetical protein